MTRTETHVTLTLGEADIIAQLLEMAGDVFGNHGCNDIPDDFYSKMGKEEQLQLAAALRKVNGSHNDDDETDDEFRRGAMYNDGILMDLMAGYLRNK